MVLVVRTVSSWGSACGRLGSQAGVAGHRLAAVARPVRVAGAVRAHQARIFLGTKTRLVRVGAHRGTGALRGWIGRRLQVLRRRLKPPGARIPVLLRRFVHTGRAGRRAWRTLVARLAGASRQVRTAIDVLRAGYAVPVVEGVRARMFANAVLLSAKRQRPASIFARSATLTMAGVGGMLVLVWLAILLMPPAARSAARSIALGIAPAEQAMLSNLAQRSVLFNGDGTVLAVLHDEIDRKVVPLAMIPEHVRNAVLTAEDRRFWEHRGFDVEGIGRALVANYHAGDITQGGSTITQQIAKSVVGDEQSLQRKLNELVYAVALEREYSKEALLERYLNQVYFGWGRYGIAAAAEEYFGMPNPSELRVEQGALLAGLIRSPGRLDPRRHPEDALERRNQILQDMGELGYLDEAEVQFLVQTPLGVVPPSEEQPLDPYLVEAVKQEFLRNPVFGPDREARSELLLSGGLRIETSLDPRLQQIAREVVDDYLPSAKGPTAAIAAVDPRDGRILAIYGGADFEQEQFNLATQGRRQPGSSFKPFVMATALQQGFPLRLRLSGDSPLILPNSGSPEWEQRGVSNYGGADYGQVDLRTALVESVNTAFAQLMMIVGVDPVLETIRMAGIDVPAATAGVNNASIALGGLERGVTPLEMASAYGTFANGGNHVSPSLITRVTGPDGIVLYERTPQPQQVLDPRVNAVMVDTMQQVVRSGTGTGARLASWANAGKTGTTQRNADAWFVGYVPVMSTAVWMGYPEGQIAMPGRTGGSIPASIWREFMTRALEGIEPMRFPRVPIGERPLAGSGRVAVPDVVGMDETEALRTLAQAKLIGEARAVPSRSRAGTVLWQRPRPGSTTESGDTVRIGVSTGKRAQPTPTSTPTPESPSPPASNVPADDPGQPGMQPPQAPPPGAGQPSGEGQGENSRRGDGAGQGRYPGRNGLISDIFDR